LDGTPWTRRRLRWTAYPLVIECLICGDRLQHEQSGSSGLCIIHLNTLSVWNHSKQQSSCQYSSFECMLVRINESGSTHSTANITFAVIYRPPMSSLSQFYDDLSDMLTRIGDNIDNDCFVVCGDFNCGRIGSTSIRAELTTVFETHGLQQHISDSTRMTPSTSSLLDLVINGADSKHIFKVAVRPTHGVLDHDLVIWLVTAATKPTRCVQTYIFRSMKNVKWQQFRLTFTA